MKRRLSVCNHTLVVTLSFLVALTTIPAPADATSLDIAEAAARSVNKQMWKGYGLPNGTLGCSAALCNVLSLSGVKSARSATVTVARRQLLATLKVTEIVVRSGEGQSLDDNRLKQLARKGDVLMAFSDTPNKPNGGPNAHCGIMADGSNVYTNDWNDGVWKKVNVHLMFDSYPYVRLLRLRQPTSSRQIGAATSSVSSSAARVSSIRKPASFSN